MALLQHKPILHSLTRKEREDLIDHSKRRNKAAGCIPSSFQFSADGTNLYFIGARTDDKKSSLFSVAVSASAESESESTNIHLTNRSRWQLESPNFASTIGTKEWYHVKRRGPSQGEKENRLVSNLLKKVNKNSLCLLHMFSSD